MNTKTMEGLAGAASSIQLTAVPMNAFRAAERRGDTGGMEKAMGYASGLMEQAGRYQEKAREGMKLEAEEAKKEEKIAQEKLQEKRRAEEDEREKQLKRPSVDSVEISREGREFLESTGSSAAVEAVSADSGEIPAGTGAAAVEAGTASAGI